MKCTVLWLAFAFAAALPAQVQPSAGKPSAERLRQELEQAKRDLDERRAEAERLLDLRIRHDLGLPVEGEIDLFRAPPVGLVPPGAAPEKLLVEENAATTVLQARCDALRLQVERLRAESLARAPKQPKADEWVTVPAAGAALPKADAAARPPAPVGETAASKPAGQLQLDLDPIRAQIDPSQDHARTAVSLFRAGQSLMDRADVLRQQGQQAAADQCDDFARERLQRAVAVLEPETNRGTPTLVDLFYLGKCRELLFRIAERRDGLSVRTDAKEYQRREQEVREPFVAITARDVELQGGKEQLGAFGRAAQTALEHFRWMNLHRGFRPRTALESITWPSTTDK